METSNSFYITLPSNACKELYPKNKASEYNTRLVRPIYLDHQYEVALTQIQFPHTWETFPVDSQNDYEKNANQFIYGEKIPPAASDTPNGDFRTDYESSKLEIPRGYYSALVDDKGDQSKALLNCLQREFDKNERARGVEATNIVFCYNDHLNQVVITVKNNYYLHLSNAMAEVLGFNVYIRENSPDAEFEHKVSKYINCQWFPEKIETPGFPYEAQNAPDLARGF